MLALRGEAGEVEPMLAQLPWDVQEQVGLDLGTLWVERHELVVVLQDQLPQQVNLAHCCGAAAQDVEDPAQEHEALHFSDEVLSGHEVQLAVDAQEDHHVKALGREHAHATVRLLRHAVLQLESRKPGRGPGPLQLSAHLLHEVEGGHGIPAERLDAMEQLVDLVLGHAA